jgi:hypothetical protein
MGQGGQLQGRFGEWPAESSRRETAGEDRERIMSDRPSAKGIPQPANQTPVVISAAKLRVTFKHEMEKATVKSCKGL